MNKWTKIWITINLVSNINISQYFTSYVSSPPAAISRETFLLKLLLVSPPII